MTEHPIVMTGESVRAILDRRKSQTRRVPSTANSLLDGYRVGGRGERRWIWDGLDWSRARVDPGPSPAGNHGPYWRVPCPENETEHRVYCLYQPGDRLWVRETWAQIFTGESCLNTISERNHCPCGGCRVEHGADTGDKYPGEWPADMGADPECPKWRSSRYMPRWASRLTLEVVSVRAERVRDITEEDAKAEGARSVHIEHLGQTWKTHRAGFEILWDSINAKRGYGWDTNWPVWPITFKVVNA